MKCEHCQADLPEASRFCNVCGADVSDPAAGPRTSSTERDLAAQLSQSCAGRYRIKHMLGRGGMGAVFLAEDLTLERPVAVKVLPPEMSHDDTLVGRFTREARTAARLDHPNIIPIYAVESTENGLNYFVMKYVEGRPLDDVVAQESTPIAECQRIIWEAARALGHAHQRGVIHRDIKPGNIMLGHEGRVILMDFGISKAAQSATSFTGTGQIIGTPYYMSPEQAKGTEVDGRSDQYSLAVVAYQLLTCQLPFGGDSIHTILYKHIFEEATPLREVRNDVPLHLESAVRRAMAKAPDDRFRTMEEFATAVWPEHPVAAPSTGSLAPGGSRTSRDAPTEITDPGTLGQPRSRPGSRPPRRPGWAVAAGIALAAGGVAGGWLAWQNWLAPGPATTDSTLAATAMGGDSQAAGAPTPDTQFVARDTAAGPSDIDQQIVTTPAQQRADPPPTPARTRPAPVEPAPTPRDARPVPRIGFLRVDVSGGWGMVYVDDVQIGETPLTDHELAPGRHVIRIERDAYRTWVDTVDVRAGETVRRQVILVRGDP